MGGEGDRGGPAVYKRIANFSRELCAGRTNGRGKRRHTEGTRGRSGWHLEHVLDELEKREDLPRIEVARRQYVLIPMFSSDRENLLIHKLMAEDAEFYFSIVKDVF